TYDGSSGEEARSSSPVPSRSWINWDAYPATRRSRASSTAAFGLSTCGGSGRLGGGTARLGSTPTRPCRVALQLLSGLQVPPELERRIERSVGLLRPVLALGLGEVQGPPVDWQGGPHARRP